MAEPSMAVTRRLTLIKHGRSRAAEPGLELACGQLVRRDSEFC